jgi:hypothetical protein
LGEKARLKRAFFCPPFKKAKNRRFFTETKRAENIGFTWPD